jgi:four helix bundle protein
MSQDLKSRTRQFALDIIEVVDVLSSAISKRVIGNQLMKSGTSVGANYRAACRARSDKEYIAKINIVLEEVDEANFWLDIIKVKSWHNVDKLIQESDELTAIFVTILKKMNNKNK